jgi:hypothetical protein
MKKICGWFLCALAWLLNILAVGVGGIYAASVVMWLHAPILKVLVVTLPVVLAVLAVAWGLNKLGRKLKTPPG